MNGLMVKIKKVRLCRSILLDFARFWISLRLKRHWSRFFRVRKWVRIFRLLGLRIQWIWQLQSKNVTPVRVGTTTNKSKGTALKTPTNPPVKEFSLRSNKKVGGGGSTTPRRRKTTSKSPTPKSKSPMART